MKYTITAENERISEMTSKIRLPIRLAPILLVSACALFPPSLVEQGIVRIDIGKSKARRLIYRAGVRMKRVIVLVIVVRYGCKSVTAINFRQDSAPFPRSRR